MPRGMSFWLTQQQMRDEIKDVTRRLGWWSLKPGDIVNAIEKCQGLKKGEKQVLIYPIEIISTRSEPLFSITQAECIREGFPNLTPIEFVEMFCRANKAKSCIPTTSVNRIEFKRYEERPMIIVTGIARSGLTAVMQMLHVGGYPCAGEYPAFEPYQIGEIPWNVCKGKAIKLVDAQLHMPHKLKKQKVILLSRDLAQQAKSLNKFINALTGLPPTSESALIRSYRKDYALIGKWVKRQHAITIRFEDIVTAPRETARVIADFSGKNLDVEKMAKVIIPRGPECHPQLLETGMI